LSLFVAIRVILFAIFNFVVTTWPIRLVTRKYRVTGKRTVFITGCDTGFGNLTAKQLDQMGMRVFAGCLTEEGARNLKAETSNNLTVVPLDVTKTESINAAYEVVQSACPDGLWALINNAGIADYTPSDFAIMPTYRRINDVNLFGLVEMTSRMMPLIKQQRGRVVNIASVAGLISAPGMSAYSISKYGVEAYSDALRRESYIWGVKVVLVEPAFMATPLIDPVKTIAMQQRGWNALPVWYRNEFGDEWLEQQIKNVKPALATADNPMKVVNVLVDATLSRFVPHRYLVGRGSGFIKLLSVIPSPITDIMFNLVHETNLPRAVREYRARGSLPPRASSSSSSASDVDAPASPLPVASAVNQAAAKKASKKGKNK